MVGVDYPQTIGRASVRRRESAAHGAMASKPCLLRLQKEYQRLSREPVPNIVAEPKPNNILEWHFVISGPADTPYAGGQYHGKLIFPSDYPYKPPAIMMLTPNGRFNTNTRLCLSMSDFHPES